MPLEAQRAARKFTVPVVWRRIVKKNERQGDELYDVLVCDHVVPADDNTYRRARACPECRVKVQEYVDRHRRVEEEPRPPGPRAQGAPRATPAPRKRSTKSRAGPRWCVYVLRCGDGSLYTGSTNDLARRLERHAAGKGARYTRSRLPVVLVHEQRVASKGAALRRELAVKRLSRAEKLALVAGARARSSAPRSTKPPRP
jgi:putative endonuclease